MKRYQGSYVEPKWKKHWLQFNETMTRRLSEGHREYGDGSFERSPRDLLSEIEEELLDVVGWGYIMWCRIQELSQHIAYESLSDGQLGLFDEEWPPDPDPEDAA